MSTWWGISPACVRNPSRDLAVRQVMAVLQLPWVGSGLDSAVHVLDEAQAVCSPL